MQNPGFSSRGGAQGIKQFNGLYDKQMGYIGTSTTSLKNILRFLDMKA